MWTFVALAIAMLLASPGAATEFDSASAWEHLVTQVEFGPRAPGTEGHAACAAWLKTQLKTHADEVQEHSFVFRDPYSGTALQLRNFKASFRPELDDRLETHSMRCVVDVPGFDRASAEYSWRHYLGERYRPGADDVPYYAAPARCEDLAGLPPAFVNALGFNLLNLGIAAFLLRRAPR